MMPLPWSLIQQRTSYTELVAWLQQQENCSYLQACLVVKRELECYRTYHSYPNHARESSP